MYLPFKQKQLIYIINFARTFSLSLKRIIVKLICDVLKWNSLKRCFPHNHAKSARSGEDSHCTSILSHLYRARQTWSRIRNLWPDTLFQFLVDLHIPLSLFTYKNVRQCRPLIADWKIGKNRSFLTIFLIFYTPGRSYELMSRRHENEVISNWINYLLNYCLYDIGKVMGQKVI